MKDTKIELVRPPVAVRRAGAGDLTVVEGAFGFGGHGFFKGLSEKLRVSRYDGCRFFIKPQMHSLGKSKKHPG